MVDDKVDDKKEGEKRIESDADPTHKIVTVGKAQQQVVDLKKAKTEEQKKD